MTDYLTNTPGIDGEVTHFEVFEVPKFQPTGQGEHIWMLVEKIGLTTHELVRRLARQFNVSPTRFGYAGLKDKHARTIQWLSVWDIDPEQAIVSANNFKVHMAMKTARKLKPGTLYGNWFHIKLSSNDARPAKETLEVLEHRTPNVFGPQRFGGNEEIGRLFIIGQTEKAKELMRTRRIPRTMTRFMIDAYGSLLFNRVVDRRLKDPELKGDLIGRFGPTGPLYGKNVPLAQDKAGEIERQVLSSEGLELSDFSGKGKRRALFVSLKGLETTVSKNELELKFFLPKGSYATAVLREIQKKY
ncbi:MAG: tRNA pseudouridine(13) synthase TruD [Candidatus Altiarchaeota archaeon]|nr:tRNA pseudouridine(13) synthase TruD [Candidatus Altiarchaeota archaeon]